MRDIIPEELDVRKCEKGVDAVMFAEKRNKGRRASQLFAGMPLLAVIIAALLVLPAPQGRALASRSQEQGTVQGLHVNKYASVNEDGTYRITLESYTTGRVSVTQTQRPVDIVLVLDTSNSMNEINWFEIYSEQYEGYHESE